MSSLTLSSNLNMENVFPDPVHQQIFSHLSPRRGELPIHVVETIAGNIAFLVKYTAGYKVLPSQVSVSVVDVRGPDNGLLGHKAMVCIHGAPGRFKVVVTKEVAYGRNVVIGLSEKVDRVVREIVSKEGNDGFGDF